MHSACLHFSPAGSGRRLRIALGLLLLRLFCAMNRL